MAGGTEGTIASLLRHSGTALVRRYAHLSPSYLQEAVEKVSAFGKPKSLIGTERPTEFKPIELAPEMLSSAPTGPKAKIMEAEIEVF